MDRRQRQSPSLADPQEALDSYLDSLLMDLPVEEADAPPPATETAAAGMPAGTATRPPAGPPVAAPRRGATPEAASGLLAARPFAEPERPLAGPLLLPRLTLAEPAAEPQAPPVAAPARTEAAVPPPASGDCVAPPAALSDAMAGSLAATGTAARHRDDEIPPPASPRDTAESRLPCWARQPFQCLTFSVAGVTLATPLEKLFGIVEWPGELTELPGYAPWFMGLLPNRGQNVRVIDTAQIIMPDGRVPDARPVLERVEYVVLIDEGRWGLAADSINQVITLSPEGVRWRGAGGKRPWLAGTAVERMCALLDIDKLGEQLAEGLRLDD